MLLALSTNTFAAKLSSTQLKDFSSKLDNNKSKLLKTIDESKIKLQKVAKEASSFTDTSLFKAASCLGAIPPENQNLDFDKITNELKNTILNEYIKLDGDIKRLSFGMTESDPILFGNNLDTFYNQHALKISMLENEYYLKTSKVKKDFLDYLENNKALLTQLAQNMEYLKSIQMAASGARSALNDFTASVNARSDFMKAIEKAKTDLENSFEKELENTLNQTLATIQANNELEAKFLIHKDNFNKKFKAEISQAQYYIFSAFFPYADYAELLEKEASAKKQFLTSSGAVNCNLLLTTTFNLGKYADGVEAKSEKLQKGLKTLNDAVKNGKLNLKVLEASGVSSFKESADKLYRKLTLNFKKMLESEKSQVPAAKTAPTEEKTNATSTETPAPNTQKVVFNQAFNKGQYHEQIKTLQTMLKNLGYYQGEINGIYSAETIEAVYQFQLKEGIITGKEKSKSGYGRFGAKTRAKLNSKM